MYLFIPFAYEQMNIPYTIVEFCYLSLSLGNNSAHKFFECFFSVGWVEYDYTQLKLGVKDTSPPPPKLKDDRRQDDPLT